MNKKYINSTAFVLMVIALICSFKLQAQILSANGTGHSLYLCSDSIPRAWGIGSAGQLANGSTSSRSIPTTIPNIGGIVAVSAGSNFSLFLKADGTVWASGLNGSGQLGLGSTTNQFNAVQIPSLSDIIAVSGGGAYSLFLKNDGTVWACGDNQMGQLGNGNTTSQQTPVQVSGLTNITAIAAGGTVSLFLKNDGTTWYCGGTITTPVQVNITSVIKITAGYGSAYFLKSDGTVWASGANDYGQLGNGTSGITMGTMFDSPVQTVALSDIIDFSASTLQSYCLFLKNDGTVWACGLNGSGQFGNGTSTGFDPNPIPAQSSLLSNIVAVAAGQYHSLFLKNDGTGWASGGNAYGQLGNYSTTNTTSPVQTNGLCPIILGVNELEEISSVRVFPNPGNGIFHFISSEVLSEISIYNLLGERIYFNSINSSTAEIDLTMQPKGVYFYKLTGNNLAIKTGKIVVE